MKKYAADLITGVRLFGAVALIFLTPLSVPFYIVYTVCGLSDAFDGPVARKLGTESRFGSILDSVTDLAFYIVMLVKLLPVIIKSLPKWMLIYILVVIVVRLGVYFMTWVLFRRFSSSHTWFNKITGAGVFLVPYFIKTPIFVVFSFLVVTVGAVGTVYEYYYHLKNRV